MVYCVSIFNYFRILQICLLISSYDPLGVEECVVWCVCVCIYIWKMTFFLLLLILVLYLYAQKILGIISLCLKIVKLVLWSNIWSIIENVSCALEECFCHSGILCRCLVDPIDLYYSNLMFPYRFCIWIYPLLTMGC